MDDPQAPPTTTLDYVALLIGGCSVLYGIGLIVVASTAHPPLLALGSLAPIAAGIPLLAIRFQQRLNTLQRSSPVDERRSQLSRVRRQKQLFGTRRRWIAACCLMGLGILGFALTALLVRSQPVRSGSRYLEADRVISYSVYVRDTALMIRAFASLLVGVLLALILAAAPGTRSSEAPASL